MTKTAYNKSYNALKRTIARPLCAMEITELEFKNLN